MSRHLRGGGGQAASFAAPRRHDTPCPGSTLTEPRAHAPPPRLAANTAEQRLETERNGATQTR